MAEDQGGPETPLPPASEGQADALPPEEDSYHSRIVIKKDGEVIIENLSMDLMELALMLDPDSPIACALDDD